MDAIFVSDRSQNRPSFRFRPIDQHTRRNVVDEVSRRNPDYLHRLFSPDVDRTAFNNFTRMHAEPNCRTEFYFGFDFLGHLSHTNVQHSICWLTVNSLMRIFPTRLRGQIHCIPYVPFFLAKIVIIENVAQEDVERLAGRAPIPCTSRQSVLKFVSRSSASLKPIAVFDPKRLRSSCF